MCPLLLLFLLLAALNPAHIVRRPSTVGHRLQPDSTDKTVILAHRNQDAAASTAAPTEDSTGKKFVFVFPESIAYYHPELAKNEVKITALHDNTNVKLIGNGQYMRSNTLTAGETWTYALNAQMELVKSNISKRILQINSDNFITVQAVCLKHNSLQTALLTPTDKLGEEYLIPPVPTIEGTTVPVDKVTKAVTERNPFKLIIINADQANRVTVDGAEPREFSLNPHQTVQIWVKDVEASRAVRAQQPVEVMFGHTCAIRKNCSCGLLYTKLSPAKEEEQKFHIPPFVAQGAEGETFVLLSGKDSTKKMPFDPNSPVVKTAGSAVLYRPGLLLTLIPESDFAACFVINTISDATNYAVIVLHKDVTDGVHVGSLPLASPEWQEQKGTEFVSTHIKLSEEKNIIWHSYSTMGAYLFGGRGEALFGNPAPIISKSPDFRGCAVTPEVIKIGEVAGSWTKSLKYCKDNDMELISFPKLQVQKQVYNRIAEVKNDSLVELWVGMRRSSLNGGWYWLNKEPVTDTNWAQDEPGPVDEGQCAMMSLESGQNFGWRDEDCCKEAHPICYSAPVLFPME